MKVYDFIKVFLAYCLIGFVLVPLKLVFWIFSAEGWDFIANLGDILSGKKKTGFLFLKGAFWAIVAVASWYVFSYVHSVGLEIVKGMQ